MKTKAEIIGTTLIAAGIIWFYVFLAGGYKDQPYGFSKESVRYYHLLVDGFRAGQLSLPVEPPPELARMADPYDPVQRGDLGMHDASYYKGRYYLYFGVGPAVVLFLPFRILTGVHFSENLAVALFCAGGFLCSLALLRGLRRRFFPACSSGMMYLGTLLLGLGNFAPVMLTRSDFWEVPIASAYGFSCLALWALWQGTYAVTKPRRWLILASAAYGIAVASRPHFVFAGAIFGLVWLWRRKERRQMGADRSCAADWSDALALLGPLAAIVAGLLVYNYLRFDDPFEFGQKYQVGGVSMRHVPAMDWRYLPINFYANFTAAAQFERYFPFIQVIRGYPGVVPRNYFGQENPYGVLVNLPAVWFALLAALGWLQLRRSSPGLGWWLILLGWHFCAVTGLVLLFAGATNRYLVDFLPSLLLLAGVGLMAGGESIRGRPWGRRMFGAAAAGLTLYSSAFTVLAAFQYNGLFKRQHPDLYARLAGVLDRPVHWWEERHASNYGPIEVTVRFTKNQPGRPEPILITGVAHLSDYLYVIYDAYGRSIQLAYDRTNYEHVVSQPIPVDYDVPHRIGIQSGSLYPEANHPFFKGWTPDEVRAAKQTLRVTIDGVPYLVGEHPFFGATPEQISIGTNPLSDNGGRKFTGSILSVRRTPPPPAVADFAGGGFLHLAVVLPSGQAGRREPLVATGVAGQGDLLFMSYEDAAHVRLGFHHAGEPPRLSDPLEIVPGRIQLLEVSLGSFYVKPSTARERELAGMLVVRFNGRPVWLESAAFHPAGQKPGIGKNYWGSEAVSPGFTGEIVGQQMAPAAQGGVDSAFAIEPYWLETGTAPQWGPVRMRLQLPTDQVGKGEPLLVSGASAAQGDYLWINYPIAGQVLIGYEHTGSGGPHTGLVPWDFSAPLTLEFSLPSLYPAGTESFFENLSLLEIASLTGKARLKLNGEVRFEAKVGAFESAPENVTFGENRISQAFGTRFTGKILSIERGRFDLPEGMTGNQGPLEILFSLPALASGREALLATGPASAADALCLEYISPGRVRFLAKPGNAEAQLGGIVALDPAARHTLRIQWGGFYPEAMLAKTASASEKNDLQHGYVVILDGQPVLSGRLDFQQRAPQAISLGAAVGSEAGAFTGRFHSVRRLPR